MAFNKHLKDGDYRQAARAIIDDVEWFDDDLPKHAYTAASTSLGRELNDAELGEIWTHVIAMDRQYAILSPSGTEAAFIAYGEAVDYSEPELDDTDIDPGVSNSH